jgi:O-antigen ligase
MWFSGLQMVRDRPLLGFTSRRNFIIWYSTRYRDPGALETVPGHVHNSVLQTAILHGIPGLGLLIWWLAVVWRAGQSRPTPDMAAIQPLLLAVFINAQVDFVIADGQRAMMLYVLLGLLLGTRRK